MARVLRVGRPKRSERGVSSARKQVSPLVRQTALGREAIVACLLVSFRKSYGGTLDALATDELAAADKLVAEKYGQREWTEEFA
jgi:lipoate-protein ligase A